MSCPIEEALCHIQHSNLTLVCSNVIRLGAVKVSTYHQQSAALEADGGDRAVCVLVTAKWSAVLEEEYCKVVYTLRCKSCRRAAGACNVKMPS